MPQFRQEYLCDWTSAMLGVIYGGEMTALRHEGRIGDIEAIEGEFVHRAWDIGIGSGGATSIWFFQVVGAQIFILDHLESSGVGVEWYAGEIRKRELERGWTSGSDFVPHDAKVKEWGSGRTRVETMTALDLKPILARNATVDDGINAVRRRAALPGYGVAIRAQT
jgi:phage terminase large subunit